MQNKITSVSNDNYMVQKEPTSFVKLLFPHSEYSNGQQFLNTDTLKPPQESEKYCALAELKINSKRILNRKIFFHSAMNGH